MDLICHRMAEDRSENRHDMIGPGPAFPGLHGFFPVPAPQITEVKDIRFDHGVFGRFAQLVTLTQHRIQQTAVTVVWTAGRDNELLLNLLKDADPGTSEQCAFRIFIITAVRPDIGARQFALDPFQRMFHVPDHDFIDVIFFAQVIAHVIISAVNAVTSVEIDPVFTECFDPGDQIVQCPVQNFHLEEIRGQVDPLVTGRPRF